MLPSGGLLLDESLLVLIAKYIILLRESVATAGKVFETFLKFDAVVHCGQWLRNCKFAY